MHVRLRTGAVLGVVLLLGIASFAQARGQDTDNTDTTGSEVVNAQQISHSDSTVKKDFDVFERLDIKNRFGLKFHSHKDVCSFNRDPGVVHCDARVVTDSNETPIVNSIAPAQSWYGPAQFLKAYNLTGQATQKTIVAIVDAYDDPTIYSDLTTYSKQYSLPVLPQCTTSAASSSVPCFQKVNQTGATSSFPTTNEGWALETALDVETIHAVCQNCTILLVEANSNTYPDLLTANDTAVALGSKIVSNSWGSVEFSGQTTFDSHFNKPGVAFVFSTGDAGYGVQYPAASPYVTAVGGTSLFLNPDNSYNSEAVWSGTGSGCSAFDPKPTHQHDSGCKKRTVADVSAVADPNTGAAVYNSFGTSPVGWVQVGGTSLAAPIIASVYALGGNIPSNSIPNTLPYATPAGLHDVTTGTNGTCTPSYLCTGVSSYDGPTGLGTPNGTSAFVGTPTSPLVVTISANPLNIKLGSSTTLTWSSTNATSCTGTNFSTGGATSGSVSVSPVATTTYTVSCAGVGGTKAASTTVGVAAKPSPVKPTANLTATPSVVTVGQSTTLAWSSTNATSCTGTNFSTGGAVSGSVSSSPTATTTYTISCMGAGGTALTSVTVGVKAALRTILTTTSGGSITDARNNVWTLSRRGQIYKNGAAAVGGGGTTALTYTIATDTMWRQDASTKGWYYLSGRWWVGPYATYR